MKEASSKRVSVFDPSRSKGSIETEGSFEEDFDRVFENMVNIGGLEERSVETEKLKKSKAKELKMLAADLGIDLALESGRYSHFLEHAVNVVLPVGWTQEFTPQGKIYYYNEIEGRYSSSHPCLDFFKRLMSNRYKKFLKRFGRKVAKGTTSRHTDEGTLG